MSSIINPLSQTKLNARIGCWIGKHANSLVCNYLLNKKKNFWDNINFLIWRNEGLKTNNTYECAD